MPGERPVDERTPATARTQLDEALGMAAWAAGQSLTLQDAWAYATGEPPGP
jgi:hypothetical protein